MELWRRHCLLKYWVRRCCHFVEKVFPDGCRFMQDNDPKQNSNAANSFLERNGVQLWRTPPESPDCNPIENLWHELKECIRREVKPQTKGELVNGIVRFWSTVDIAKCTKYIWHLHKVLPKMIELNGAATGY